MVLAQKDDGLNHFSAEIDHLLLTSCVTNVNLPEAQPPRLRLSKAQVRRAVLALMSDGPTAQASQWLEQDDGKTLDDRTSTKPLPNGISPSRHSFLTDRTKRSACALQFGARNGLWSRAHVSSNSRTARLHFRSRSQIKTRSPSSTPSPGAVSWRTTWLRRPR